MGIGLHRGVGTGTRFGMLLGASLLATMIVGPVQADNVKFVDVRFFSTKGDFDWDKIVYGDNFDQRTLHELQLKIEFENPDGNEFDIEVRGFFNDQEYKVEPIENLLDDGAVNSGFAGDSGNPGTVEAGVYKAQIWYQGDLVKTVAAVVAVPAAPPVVRGVGRPNGMPAGGLVDLPPARPGLAPAAPGVLVLPGRAFPPGAPNVPRGGAVVGREQPAPQHNQLQKMTAVGLAMGFAADWESAGGIDTIVGISPDGKVRIQAAVSQASTILGAVAGLHREFGGWCEGLNLTDPESMRVVNGLKVLSIGGTARAINGGQLLDVAVDILDVNGKIVVVSTRGPSEAMDRYFGDIVLSQKSLIQAR